MDLSNAVLCMAAYNRLPLLRIALLGVLAFGKGLKHVHVIDDGSTDLDVPAYLKSLAASGLIEYDRLPVNQGVGACVRRAARKYSNESDLFFWMDSDVLIGHKTLPTLIDSFDHWTAKGEKIGMLSAVAHPNYTPVHNPEPFCLGHSRNSDTALVLYPSEVLRLHWRTIQAIRHRQTAQFTRKIRGEHYRRALCIAPKAPMVHVGQPFGTINQTSSATHWVGIPPALPGFPESLDREAFVRDYPESAEDLASWLIINHLPADVQAKVRMADAAAERAKSPPSVYIQGKCPKASLLIPACNQRDEVGLTIESARIGLGDMAADTEIIVLDDHSTDGCCHNLPKDVLILHPRKRLGVSGARQELAAQARGEVLLWSDPHCRFQPGGLKVMAERALAENGWVEAWSCGGEKSRVRSGFLWLDANPSWMRVRRAYKDKPLPKYMALYGTVYAVSRKNYDQAPWPLLPGCWGNSEQALTVRCWFQRMPIILEESVVNIHKDHIWHEKFGIPRKRFPFRVRKSEAAANRHYTMAAFFPRSYHAFWEPLLDKTFPKQVEEAKKPLKSRAFRAFCKQIAAEKSDVRSEEGFFRAVLSRDPPAGIEIVQPPGPSNETEYRKQQEHRSKPKEYKGMWVRLRRAIDWCVKHVPEDARGSLLDVGSRDGMSLELYAKKGFREVEGLEYSRKAAEHARKMGRNVKTGDMRHLPHADATFDVVSTIHCLEHVPKAADAIKELFRVLKPGGYLIAVVPMEGTSTDIAHYFCWPNTDALAATLKMEAGCPFNVLAATDMANRNGNREMFLVCQKGL